MYLECVVEILLEWHIICEFKIKLVGLIFFSSEKQRKPNRNQNSTEGSAEKTQHSTKKRIARRMGTDKNLGCTYDLSRMKKRSSATIVVCS